MLGHLFHQQLLLFGKVIKSLEEEASPEEVHLDNLVFSLCFQSEDGIMTTPFPAPATMSSLL